MGNALTRTALGFAAEALRRRGSQRGDDPDFGAATWLTGVRPGTLLAAAPIKAAGVTGPNPAEAWRIDYATSDRRSRILTATGAVFCSRTPWAGKGPQPTIAFAPSTQGAAVRCDPSLSCTAGVAARINPLDVVLAHEQLVINLLLAHGANVVLTDYPRDPEDKVQLYCDHTSGARALADAVLAAGELGVESTNLGLWGFSQGGGAAAAWLEEPEYAPQLQPLAAVVGAAPVDLEAQLRHVDGSLAGVVIMYGIAGMMAADPEIAAEVAPHLSPAGVEALLFCSEVCAIGAVARRPWVSTRRWTTSGLAMGELLPGLPTVATYLDETRVGQRAPLRIPLRLWGSRNDDIVPYRAIERLAGDWGVPLQTRTMPRLPGRSGLNHFAPYFQHVAGDAEWLLGQLGR